MRRAASVAACSGDAILDDAGQIEPQQGANWQVHSTSTRLASLPAKYNWMLAVERFWSGPWDAACVWDDEDIYLPWHLSAALAALHAGGLPSRELTARGRELERDCEESGVFMMRDPLD